MFYNYSNDYKLYALSLLVRYPSLYLYFLYTLYFKNINKVLIIIYLYFLYTLCCDIIPISIHNELFQWLYNIWL